MSLVESFDKSTYSSLEIQGFDKGKNGENENTFTAYFKGNYNQEVDKRNSIESALKVLNSYCKAQGRTDDVTYWDGQVREMMETVKRIREMLPARTKVDNVFKFCDEEVGDSKLPETEEDLKASFTEIAKMDAILKLKQAEEKKAKLETIQSEEESRDILTKMQCFERSTGIRNNFEEFMRLLNDSETTESNSVALPQLEFVVKEEQKEDKNKKEDKKEIQDSKQQQPPQKTNSKFVERNIKLAKCGRGTLSVTDEEKTRLEDLLEDPENPSKVAAESKESKESKEPSTEDFEDSCIPEEECFGIDCEIQSALSKIDEQLEALRSKGSSSVCSISFLERDKSEEKIPEEEKQKEEEKQNVNKRKKREKTPERLEKINQQLQLMNSISREEIKPLSEKELTNLIKQSKRSLGDWKKGGERPEDFKLENTKTPENVIAELVSNAKTLMPKFKYRFGKS